MSMRHPQHTHHQCFAQLEFKQEAIDALLRTIENKDAEIEQLRAELKDAADSADALQLEHDHCL